MNNGKSSSLEQLLLFDNFQILGTPFKFAEVIHKREGGKWNEAQRKASELIKANAAWNYLEDLRERMSTEEQSQTTLAIEPAQTEVPNIPAGQPAQFNQEDKEQKQNEDMFEENYILLTRFAPELEEELQTLTEKSILSGKSATNQHGSTSIKSVEKDKYGYYLLLEIHESAQPQQQILLFVSTAKKTVQVLYSENSSGKFEVYSDIYTREMVNPHQLEIQNNHLTKQLERLIGFKLSIPTIDVVPVQEQTPQKETSPDEAFEKALIPYIKYNDEFKRHSNERYLDELIEKNEELEKENQELNDEVEETDEFLKKSVFPTLYSHNFKLLKVLISNFTNEILLKSFTANLVPENEHYPTFKINFDNITDNIICDIYEVNATENAETHHCSFVIKASSQALFIGCSDQFLTLKEDMHLWDDFEVSDNGLRGNSALHNFFLTLLANGYRSTISNRVYPIQIVKNPPKKADEIETVEAVEEVQESESDGTGAVVAVLATIGLGILGFKFLK
jgi:hypothetical protein